MSDAGNGVVRIFSAKACAAPLEKARQFMDFLASAASRKFYKEFGWCVPGE